MVARLLSENAREERNNFARVWNDQSLFSGLPAHLLQYESLTPLSIGC